MNKAWRVVMVVAGVTLSSAVLASLPTASLTKPATTQGERPDVRRRFVGPKGCCDVDPDMCPRAATPVTLTHARALAVIRDDGDSARRCLTAKTPAAKVRFEVDPRGRARRIAVVDDVPGEVAACLVGAVSAWRFPATTQGLTAPLSFRFARRVP